MAMVTVSMALAGGAMKNEEDEPLSINQTDRDEPFDSADILGQFMKLISSSLSLGQNEIEKLAESLNSE